MSAVPARRLRAFAAAALTTSGAVLAAGCGRGDPYLEGSLTEVVDLTYRKVDVRRSDSELALRFVAPQGAGENVVLRVTVSTIGAALDANEALDLAERDDLGEIRAQVTRNVIDDPLQVLPPLSRGKLTFHKSLLPQTVVTGELHLTFSQGTEVASGRTVFGTFEAKVE